MNDACYLRDRAEQCLEIARQMSDAKAAEGLRQRAAEYRAQADQLEAGAGDAAPLPMLAQGNR